MSIGFKIKRLREERNLTQPELASILEISQAKLSNIENQQTKKIDFLLMDKVCHYFDKDFSFFAENNTINNNVEKNYGSVVGSNYGDITITPENLILELKKIVAENVLLKEENEKLRSRN